MARELESSESYFLARQTDRSRESPCGDLDNAATERKKERKTLTATQSRSHLTDYVVSSLVVAIYSSAGTYM